MYTWVHMFYIKNTTIITDTLNEVRDKHLSEVIQRANQVIVF